MFCRNCGSNKNQETNFCTSCGVPYGTGKNYCPNCGEPTNEHAVVCVKCGCDFAQFNNYHGFTGGQSQKSKLAAGLFGIFLGWLGIHNFYLGFTNKAIAQVLLGTVGTLACGIGPAISGIWGFVEGILILVGNINTDAQGLTLRD